MTDKYCDGITADDADNRSRAQIVLDRVKAARAGKKYVRVPLPNGTGYKEVEKSKHQRLMAKMKTYTLMLSRKFPKGHRREGKLTYFAESLGNALDNAAATYTEDEDGNSIAILSRKIHTIQPDFVKWSTRIAAIQRGEACLSIRQWYGLHPVEIARLTAESGIGVQPLLFPAGDIDQPIIFNGDTAIAGMDGELANNDGLTYDDWRSLFAGKNLLKAMAIIHFTKFRYEG